MKTNFLLRILFLLLIVTFTSCEKDEEFKPNDDYYQTEDPEPDNKYSGTVQDIKSLLGSDIYDVIIKSGYAIHTGNNPPNVNGHFLLSEALLKSSTVPGDFTNQRFEPYSIHFSDFDKESLTVSYKGMQGGQQDQGTGVFISGDDDYFTSILTTVSTYNFEDAKSAVLITGKLTSQGIVDCEFMYIMVDNYGNPTGQWIEEGSYRILYDKDGLASER